MYPLVELIRRGRVEQILGIIDVFASSTHASPQVDRRRRGLEFVVFDKETHTAKYYYLLLHARVLNVSRINVGFVTITENNHFKRFYGLITQCQILTHHIINMN